MVQLQLRHTAPGECGDSLGSEKIELGDDDVSRKDHDGNLSHDDLHIKLDETESTLLIERSPRIDKKWLLSCHEQTCRYRLR